MDINLINQFNGEKLECPNCESTYIISTVDVNSDWVWCARCKTKLGLTVPDSYKDAAKKAADIERTGLNYEDMFNDPS